MKNWLFLMNNLHISNYFHFINIIYIILMNSFSNWINKKRPNNGKCRDMIDFSSISLRIYIHPMYINSTTKFVTTLMHPLQLSLSWANSLSKEHKQGVGAVRSMSGGAQTRSWRGATDAWVNYPVRYREMSTNLSGQEATYSKIWLAKKQVNVDWGSITPTHYPKNISKCHGSSNEHWLRS